MTDPSALTLTFLRAHPHDAARVLEALPAQEITALLDRIPRGLAAGLLSEMLHWVAARALDGLDDARCAAILGAQDPRAAATVLRLLPERSEALLGHLPRSRALAIRHRLAYPAHRVGAWMDGRALALRPESSAAQGLAALRHHGHSGIQAIYVVGHRRRLRGRVSLAALLRAAPEATLGSLSQAAAHALDAATYVSAAASDPGWQQASTLPVLEHEAFAGVLQHADLQRALAAEAAAAAGPDLPALAEDALRGYAGAVAGLLQTGMELFTVSGRRG
jgi:Mg/Co/Ni transporter MgtE